ncbi:hypothetical protein EY332_20940 [Shigella sonnei]|uniref:Uncharacterized protein n=2 Tax=Enterobacteriaceae TaxID=543 RepID=A0A7A6XT03_ECOLX|nr:hypothetical protein [Salmonella enterica subsp. enterica serovar Enteritidis]ECB4230351.1 hypothetical protein [Salmonella enterica subsp. enterica serovar Newport]ECD0769364.1 hypothetical protein [Salmonella enterica subsp. enterica serovar Papuana]ECX4590963.1 hypothetical protein [Salmonella enterica]EEW4281635.1 hypothetical protein [Escherichia coli]EFW0465578.1 hypothetical protein [Shigella sonnei]KAB5350759.1 hypothetical protein GAA37_21710 [Bacteroides salyersiae]MJV92248.1 hy
MIPLILRKNASLFSYPKCPHPTQNQLFADLLFKSCCYGFKNIFSYSDLYKSTSSTTLWRRYGDPT